MLQSTFISHSTADRPFVRLVARLLRFHGVRPWTSEDLKPGADWENRILQEIEANDAFLVVVSDGAKGSSWVRREVKAAFGTDKAVLPLLLDGTPLRAVDPRLERHQAIDFRVDYEAAFEKLMEGFGRVFLPDRQLVVSDRRAAERRVSTERRRSNLRQRLRIGFWKACQAKSGSGKFDRVRVSLTRIAAAVEGVRAEAAAYRYEERSSGRAVPLDEALEHAAQAVLEKPELRDKEVPIVWIVEALAEELAEAYQVTPCDRRRVPGDRRHETRGGATKRRRADDGPPSARA